MSNDKKDDLKADQNTTGLSGAPARSFFDLAGRLHEAQGELANQVVGAITHTDLAQKFSEPINAALARQYLKGRSIAQERSAQGKKDDDIADLNGDQVTALRAYQKVHEQLPAQIPFVDRDALMRQVERNIEARARTNAIVPPPHGAPASQPTAQPKAPAISAHSDAQAGQAGSRPDKSKDISNQVDSRQAAPRSPVKEQVGERTDRDTITGTGSSRDNTPHPGERRPVTPNSDGPAARLDTAKDNSKVSEKVTPPGPHEPLARELKAQTPIVSGESAPRAVLEANPPAHLSQTRAEAEAPKPTKEGGQKSPDTAIPPERPSPSPVLRSLSATGGQAAPEGKTFTASQAERGESKPIARVLSASDKVSVVPSGQLQRAVNIVDCKAMQVVSAQRAFPFGRFFGRPEIYSPLIATQSHVVSGSAQLDHGVGHRLVQPAGRNDQLAHSKQNEVPNSRQNELPSSKQHEFPHRKHNEHPQSGADQHSSDHHSNQPKHGPVHDRNENKRDDRREDQREEHISDRRKEFSARDESHSQESHSENYHGALAHPQEKGGTSDSVNTAGGIGAISPQRPIRAVDTGGREVSPFGKDSEDIKAPDDQTGGEPAGGKGGPIKTYVVKGLVPDRRYITGTELAFVAIMALAGTARARPGENATEDNLKQSRRQYVLVEEESWLSPDYANSSPDGEQQTGQTVARFENAQSGKGESKSGSREPGESTKPHSRKEPTPRKVLLRPQILVHEGDDLADMAEALFNDSRLAHLIADINAAGIEQRYVKNQRVVKLYTRQRLSLPVHQDVLQYEASMLGKAVLPPLITIVESTAVDQELLAHGLSGMLGLASKNRDPLQKDNQGDQETP